jgi:hypothetical protein
VKNSTKTINKNMDNFKKYIEFQKLIEEKKSICLEDFNWAKEISKQIPNLNIEIPSITKKSRIIFIDRNKNPIYIRLKDGSKLYFTIDQYRRIDGKPEIGKEMEFKLQRLSQDKSQNTSQIMSCKII